MKRPQSPPRFIVFVAFICAATASMALNVPAAFAQRTYEGQLTGFDYPAGITVTPFNDVWVADPGDGGLISKFSPAGALLSKQTGSETLYGCPEHSLASDFSENLFIALGAGCRPEVESFDSAEALTPFAIRIAEHNRQLPFIGIDDPSGYLHEHILATQVARTENDRPAVESYEYLGNEANFIGTAPYIHEAEIRGTPAGEFISPGALALDPSENIYVIENAGHLIDKFSPEGIFLQEYKGTGVPEGFSNELTGLAIDPATGDLLVVDSGHNVVDEIDPSGHFLAQITGGAEGKSFKGLSGGIALNSAGRLYLADGVAGVVDIYGPSSTTPTVPGVSYDAPPNPEPNIAELKGEINPEGASLTGCHFEYGIETPSEASVPCEPPAASIPSDHLNHPVAAVLADLRGHTTYLYRLVATNADGTSDAPATALTTSSPSKPTIETSSVITTGPTSATFTADISDGFGLTIGRFEYGTSAAYGASTPFETPMTTGAGDTGELSASVTGLLPGTTYHFRADALNFSGLGEGADQTFTTSDTPKVQPLPATDVTQTTAILNADINPSGSPTTYRFEYGREASYDTRTPESHLVGTDNTLQEAIAEISGLTPSTTYHFRVVAINGVGTGEGVDQVLTTAPSVPVPTESVRCKHGFVKRHRRCVKLRRRQRHLNHGRGKRRA